MTRSTFLSALTAVLLLPASGFAEATPDASGVAGGGDAAAEMNWEQFDDPGFDPAVETEPAATAEPSDAEILGSISGDVPAATGTQADPRIQLESTGTSAPVQSSGVVLGPRGVDDLGRAGRLHTVARGDTLWDLSAAYLGTPWVWPSVWIDNDDIANPHMISPGDMIWITANEMRVVTDAEAEAFLTSVADSGSEMPAESMEEMPVAAFDDSNDMSDVAADEPSTLEAFPVAIPGASTESTKRGQRVTVSRREAMGFVSAEKFKGASSIVGSPIERIYISQGDDIIIGMGEGDVEVGDQFSIFTVIEEVRDPQTLRLLGHHVDPLGWAEVTELTGDTSIAKVRTAYAEIDRGARLIVREPVDKTVEVRSTPDVIEGEVVFLPSGRTLMADGGYVYLNRGEFHGVELGSELEVFDGGSIVEDKARNVDVRTPDHVVARLVVVSVESDSAVGFVLWSNREIAVGDTFRPSIRRLARR